MELPDTPASLYDYAALAAREGFSRVVGIDEVGRGPLAGPVVVAAVYLPPELRIEGVNDSKRLTARQRERLYAVLTGTAEIGIGLAVLEAADVDRLNIYQATCVGMRLAAERVKADFALVDGRPVRGLPCPSVGIVKGDGKSASIAAASIIAKVHRDRLMAEYEERFPGYGFARHKGYGTPQHLEALRRLGPCPEHRRSFAPVAQAAGERRVQGDLFHSTAPMKVASS